MKFTLSEELPFIKGKNILSGTIEKRSGTYELNSGSFRQVLKLNQFEQLVKVAKIDEVPAPEKLAESSSSSSATTVKTDGSEIAESGSEDSKKSPVKRASRRKSADSKK